MEKRISQKQALKRIDSWRKAPEAIRIEAVMRGMRV